MKTILSLLFCVFTCLLQVHAQEITVTGKIVDDTGSAVPGVNIAVKGTGQGTLTDMDGRYTLSANPIRRLSSPFLDIKLKRYR